jgi:hypothetical protein
MAPFAGPSGPFWSERGQYRSFRLPLRSRGISPRRCARRRGPFFSAGHTVGDHRSLPDEREIDAYAQREQRKCRGKTESFGAAADPDHDQQGHVHAETSLLGRVVAGPPGWGDISPYFARVPSRLRWCFYGALVVPWPGAGQSGRLRVLHELRLDDPGSGTQPPHSLRRAILVALRWVAAPRALDSTALGLRGDRLRERCAQLGDEARRLLRGNRGQASSACSGSWAAPNARSYSYRRDQDATVTWRRPISSLNLSSRLQQPQHEVTGEDVQLLV